jgi:glycerate kinase
VRIVVAPDSFKGSLSAAAAAEAVAEGIRRAKAPAKHGRGSTRIDVDLCPMADGGEGTLDVLLAAHRGQRRRVPCHGPLGHPLVAPVGLIEHGSTAVIELATAAGLALVPAADRDPLHATTFGVGELIAAALDAEVDCIIVGLGGSATVDGGCGLAQALGLRLLDETGRQLSTSGGVYPRRMAAPPDEAGNVSPFPPARLGEVRAIDPADLLERIGDTHITFAADVLNPLLGPNGAAHVFGPQKGADEHAVQMLENALTNWAGVLERASGVKVRDEPGTGAAGGAAAPLVALVGASIVPGADLILEAVRLRDRLAGADLVITGEGRLDGQSLMGKVTGSVARLARGLGIPCIAVAGALGPGHEQAAALFDHVITLSRPEENPAAAMREARERLIAAGEEAVRLVDERRGLSPPFSKPSG